MSSAVFMFKLLSGFLDVPDLRVLLSVNDSRYETRNRHHFNEFAHVTDYEMNAPLSRMIRLYNDYYVEFRNSNSIHSFKQKIRMRLRYG